MASIWPFFRADLASFVSLYTKGSLPGCTKSVMYCRLVVPTCAPSLASLSSAREVAPATGDPSSAITAWLTV